MAQCHVACGRTEASMEPLFGECWFFAVIVSGNLAGNGRDRLSSVGATAFRCHIICVRRISFITRLSALSPFNLRAGALVRAAHDTLERAEERWCGTGSRLPTFCVCVFPLEPRCWFYCSVSLQAECTLGVSPTVGAVQGPWRNGNRAQVN